MFYLHHVHPIGIHMRSDKPHEYESIYNEIRSSLLRYASRYFKRPQDIEDVVQEAFVKVIEAHQNRTINEPKHYLYRTTKNLALKEISKSANKLTDSVGDFEPDMVSMVGGTLEDDFEAKERLGLLLNAIRELPPKCQRVFVLRRIYGYSHKEISEEMSISVKTVEIHLTRAILHCTEYMEELDANAGKPKTDISV